MENTSVKTDDFRIYLQQELIQRCKRNHKYSLRSFARTLNISPSALSAILNRRRTLTDKMKKRLGLKLGMNMGDIQRFVTNKSKSTDFTQLSIDTFHMISEWYHDAILELIHIKGFVSNPKWISSKLGLTLSEVNFALERLKRLGMIEVNERGEYIDRTNGNTTTLHENLSTHAHRNYQIELLRKSISAIENVPLELRDNTSMCLAVNLSDLAEIKKRITRFRRSLAKYIQRKKDFNSVYELSVSFIPLTKGEEL